jgi:RimJ/RimL family protein N-acetyltransferase
MRIKNCTEEDVTVVGEFYDRIVLWLDQHVNYPKWLYKVYPSEISVREMTADGSQFVCEEDGTIIGAFVLNTDPQGSYNKGSWKQNLPDGSYLVLHSLAIDPFMHGKGLGTEVINFCVDKAMEEGYKALRVDIVPDNIPARRLYEKNGFIWAGDVDLERGIENIPLFSLYEKVVPTVSD